MIIRLHVFFIISTIFIAIFVVAPHNASAQEEDENVTIPLDHFYLIPENGSGLRAFLSKFHWSFSTGYGRTFYKQDLSGFGLLQQQDSLPFIFDNNLNVAGGNISSGYNYWFNDINSRGNTTYDPANDFIVNADSVDLKFKAPGTSIPLNLSVHFEFDRYKIGGGFAFEYHRPGTFAPTVYEDRINSYEPDFGSTFFKKYYVILGANVYQYYEYSLNVDAHIGAFNLSKKFNKNIIQKGIYVNLGATIERDMSEYFTLFVRPGFDLKNYTLNIPETDLSISQSMNAFYITVGFTYRLPKFPKCFLKQCTTQINHQHGEKVYRSRVHPFYKKQNPHHGENYPSLIKYKKKNKNKMNAY